MEQNDFDITEGVDYAAVNRSKHTIDIVEKALTEGILIWVSEV